MTIQVAIKLLLDWELLERFISRRGYYTSVKSINDTRRIVAIEICRASAGVTSFKK